MEAVQEFHKIINEIPRKATIAKDELITLCPLGVSYTFIPQAIITVMQQDSITNQEYYHAVRVSIYNGSYFDFMFDFLFYCRATPIDS